MQRMFANCELLAMVLIYVILIDHINCQRETRDNSIYFSSNICKNIQFEGLRLISLRGRTFASLRWNLILKVDIG